MSTASQNTLLKVLEEPPSKLLFILLAESSGKLLETVVSRCTVFSLFPPNEEVGLKFLCEQGLEREKSKEILKLERGNIGKALTTIVGNKKKLAVEIANEYLENVLSGNAYGALLCTVRLEKDRPLANDFIFELKELTISKIKAATSLQRTAKELANIYDTVIAAEASLVTNINLPLFFSYLTSKLIG